MTARTFCWNDRFFKGGDSFRGFALAGIGPREISAQAGENALGGDAYAIGTAELRLPDFLPADYGVGLSLFTRCSARSAISIPEQSGSDCAVPGSTCIKDNMALRATAGLGISWKSPFGPIADLARHAVREANLR